MKLEVAIARPRVTRCSKTAPAITTFHLLAAGTGLPKSRDRDQPRRRRMWVKGAFVDPDKHATHGAGWKYDDGHAGTTAPLYAVGACGGSENVAAGPHNLKFRQLCDRKPRRRVFVLRFELRRTPLEVKRGGNVRNAPKMD